MTDHRVPLALLDVAFADPRRAVVPHVDGRQVIVDVIEFEPLAAQTPAGAELRTNERRARFSFRYDQLPDRESLPSGSTVRLPDGQVGVIDGVDEHDQEVVVYYLRTPAVQVP